MANIKIKESKKGTFTVAARKHGMGVQQFADKVLNNKEGYPTGLVKKATFAKNISRKYAYGGQVQDPATDMGTANAAAGVASNIGPIGGIIGAAWGLGNKFGEMDANKNIKFTREGRLTSTNQAASTIARGAQFDPIGSAMRSAKEGGSFGEVLATVSGFGGLFAKKRAKRMEKRQTEEADRIYNQELAGKRLQELSEEPAYSSMYALGGTVGDPNIYGAGTNVPVEVEGGESVELPSGQGFEIEGPQHSEGGVGMTLPENTRVFSDKLTLPDSKETFSDANKKILGKVSKYEAILGNPKSTPLAKNTARKMLAKLEQEQDGLFEIQQRINHNHIGSRKQFKWGGNVFKFDNLADYGYGTGNEAYSNTGIKGRLQNINWDNTKNTANSIASISPALYNLGQGLFGKATKYSERDFANPYEASALALMSNRRVNIDPILEESRASSATARYNLRNAARTRGELMGNYAPISSSEARANASARMQQQQLQNQYAGETAQLMSELGSERARTKMSIAEMNAQAKAAKRGMTSAGLAQLSKYAQVQKQGKNLKKADSIKLSMLKMQYPEIYEELISSIGE